MKTIAHISKNMGDDFGKAYFAPLMNFRVSEVVSDVTDHYR